MKNEIDIVINSVSNGFLVRPNYRNEAFKVSEMMVFQTMAGLQAFLDDHYAHRLTNAVQD